VVVAFWIVAALLATTQLPAIGEAQGGALGDLVPRDAEATAPSPTSRHSTLSGRSPTPSAR